MKPTTLEKFNRIQATRFAPTTSIEELEHIAFTAFLMAAIDNYIDDDEVQVIHEFIHEYWDKSYGNKITFLNKVDSKLSSFLFPTDSPPTFEEQKQKFMDEVTPTLSKHQQLALLYLLKQVMEADGIEEPREVSLLVAFADYLSL